MKYAALVVMMCLSGCQVSQEKPAIQNDINVADTAQSPITSEHSSIECTAPTQQQLAMLRHAVERNLLPHSRAMVRVHTEGTLPHRDIRDQSIEAEKDWRLMRELAQLWKAERRPEDAQMLSRLLSDWANTYRPDFNPIDETNLGAYIDAYVIAHDALDPATQSKARQFIRVLGEGYLQQLEDGFRPSDGRWINNWNSHRIKLAALASAALDDKAMWGRVRKEFIAQLAHNIRADGTTVDFEQRDALHYVVYDLEPLVRTAQVARWYNNEDWLALKGSSGGSVAAALNWLEPYARGEKTHKEFVHSRVRFDAERNAAGVKGFSGLWNPVLSAPLYSIAATLDAHYSELAKQLNPNDRTVPICWMH